MADIVKSLIIAAAWLPAGCATSSGVGDAATSPPTTVEAVGVVSEQLRLPRGFLPPADAPDSLALLPPPPAAGSAVMAADQQAYADALTATAERQALAARDADLGWPGVVSSFEPIAGVSLTDGSKPHAEMLLRRAMTDAGLATYRAKTHYNRVRPFAENAGPSCTPAEEEALRGDGSYPSGHTAIGWMLALVLTGLLPDRQDALLRRGYDFGQSRVICRVHWYSDTVAGRNVASATYARLQADPIFRAQAELARQEIAAAR
ncbi:acid phosphatase [Croceicoccus marinus]|jgi:acid phosphatase (class A)|uniref:Acid phosphatase n=1 Tax=Croceicoccus marinus TaxID=450378 RepID=A0A7G6VW03_9SPHN|nr:phosphatase PAP2 family protein [Croceicoccus marinus]QNE05918.1 phosphatase PAP2 family protein [Croceicoccus marinus]